MDIYVEQKLPNVYWQAIAADTYEDGGWSLSQGREKVLHFPDEGALNTPFGLARSVVTQTVINLLPNSSILYGAPEIVNSDRQILVTLTRDQAGNALVDSVQSRFALRAGDTYQVQSRISYADAESLRNASATYPDWVSAAYLQYPDTITPETLRLAQELTAGYDNAFDKTIAVRNYLRQNIVYNDQIPAPPPDIEPIHYVLFIGKEGYCDYYASAMAIMLRSQGIATRVVRGYAQGEWDEASRSYRVRASNAHTWVEVYFPGYGWIQFEPTASLPPELRAESAGNPGDNFPSPSIPPAGREEFLPDLGLEENPEDLLEGLDRQGSPELAPNRSATVAQIAGAAVIGLVAFGAIFVANQVNQKVEASVERSYGRLESWARWLGVWFGPTHTPYERADLIISAVPESKAPVRNLTGQFVARLFSPEHSGDPAFRPQEEWKTLRPILLRRTFGRWLDRFRRDKSGV
jgi:transglutaminase-like putative cysteine protease